ncbi:hypothetical protein NUW54_g6856 [Trametes sanguinea]|uniref:Uncharacterized protein n=1 Tax=Trametes sanguinea TaxID=158606 RepID=A0ACC1PSI4_9APHY|nr:hypothetical protein NUW54_g6856 [Trametes sanguinea]
MLRLPGSRGFQPIRVQRCTTGQSRSFTSRTSCLTIPRSAPSTLFLLRQARAIRTMSIAQLPAKMQAIGINKTGDFDVIEKLELPVPQNAPGNVLVKVGGLTSYSGYSGSP